MLMLAPIWRVNNDCLISRFARKGNDVGFAMVEPDDDMIRLHGGFRD
jgi:hypothetical protein